MSSDSEGNYARTTVTYFIFSSPQPVMGMCVCVCGGVFYVHVCVRVCVSLLCCNESVMLLTWNILKTVVPRPQQRSAAVCVCVCSVGVVSAAGRAPAQMAAFRWLKYSFIISRLQVVKLPSLSLCTYAYIYNHARVCVCVCGSALCICM